jgi:hypothetical protein
MSGRRSRERRRAAAERAADAPRVPLRRRALIRAAIVAALLGFGTGWLVRLWLDWNSESAADRAAESLRKQAREQITR